MDTLYSLFVSPITETFFQKSLIGGCVVAIVCGVVGCLVILRRMSFLGDALSHAMIAGVAGGYLFMKILFGVEAYAPAMLIGSLIAAVLTVALIGFVSRLSRIKEDTAIGIMYTGVFAAGVVAVSIFNNYIHIDLMHFIMGDVLGVTDTDLWMSTVTSALVLSVMVLFFRQFKLTSFDPIMAASIGMPVVLIDYALTTCVSMVVVSAVSMVGVILVVGLLITPAATAYLLSDRLERMMVLAAIFGVTSVVGGLYLCVWLDSAGGGAIMLFCTIQFMVVMAVSPRYGLIARWLRLRRMLPQQVVEDVLVSVVRSGDEAPVSQIEIHDHGAARMPRVLKTLAAQGVIELTDGLVRLTEKGRAEAERILRAHRLWETYLHHVGTPAGEIHERAHNLEHMHDNRTVAYLDDLLGHPETDPHGQAIPEDPECRVEDASVPLSRLRTGRGGIVERVPPDAESAGLKAGESIRISGRNEAEHAWIVETGSGDRVAVPHGAADLILIKCSG